MGSTWAFKITASLIKPTRETLLDYCSYVLLIVSIIAITRVIIGHEELKQTCHNETHFHRHEIINSSSYWNYVNSDEENKENGVLKELEQLSNSSLLNRIVENDFSEKHRELNEQPNSEEQFFCVKYYQAYFPYILIVESLVLLLTGILWVKMPKVESLVLEFSNILHESRTSNWLKNIASSANQSNTVLVKDYMEVHILLEELFQSHTNYSDKAEARQLFEKIQKFCQDHEHSTSLWMSYIRKSLIQLGFWLFMLTINIYLFIKLEFYIGCDTPDVFCSHDTFLRIIWFMAQLLIVIYGMFNCATLKWINEKSVSSGQCSLCKLFFGYLSIDQSRSKDTSPNTYTRSKSFECAPFCIDHNQKMVYNDMALLLYLVSSSNTISLPYFTVFLFDEWKERFSSLSRDYVSSNRNCMLENRGLSNDLTKLDRLPLNSDSSSERSSDDVFDTNASVKLV